MNAPDSRKRVTAARKVPGSRKARHSRDFFSELRCQCKLIAIADRRDAGWQQLIRPPE